MNKSAQLKKELRYQQWFAEVQEYNSRPEGMTVREWCSLKGIKAPTFYDHLHKVQEYYMDELQQTNSQELIKQQQPELIIDKSVGELDGYTAQSVNNNVPTNNLDTINQSQSQSTSVGS